METNLTDLLHIFSTPRPNGSKAVRRVSFLIQEWLRDHNIPHRVHTYTQYPYFFEASGVWIILTRILLALAAWLNWGWWTPIIALASLLGGTLDSALHIPLVTWPGKCLGENILIDLSPKPPFDCAAPSDETQGVAPPPFDCAANPAAPLREEEDSEFEALTPDESSIIHHPSSFELLLSAHYDSKTELLDHRQRMFFLRNIFTGILLNVLVGLSGALQAAWGFNPPVWGTWVYWTGALLSLPLAALALGYGLNLSLGRLVKPSPGAVDNGAACVILLKLAERLQRHASSLHITIALFSGEEIDRQGSRAYVRSRAWTGSEKLLNLEAMAQDGDYVTWQRDGSVYRLRPTDTRLDKAICRAVKHVTGKDPVPGGPVLSDAAPFIEKGLPVAVLGTYDRRWRDTGFHRPSDNLERVSVDRINEGVEILLRFIEEVAN